MLEKLSFCHSAITVPKNMRTCTTECTGSGPAQGYTGMICDLGFCDNAYWNTGGCVMDDGTCSYTVTCGGSKNVTGSCT